MQLAFDRSMAKERLSMNNQLCLVRSTLVDLNLDERHSYPFIISSYRFDGGSNTAEDPFGILSLVEHI